MNPSQAPPEPMRFRRAARRSAPRSRFGMLVSEAPGTAQPARSITFGVDTACSTPSIKPFVRPAKRVAPWSTTPAGPGARGASTAGRFPAPTGPTGSVRPPPDAARAGNRGRADRACVRRRTLTLLRAWPRQEPAATRGAVLRRHRLDHPGSGPSPWWARTGPPGTEAELKDLLTHHGSW